MRLGQGAFTLIDESYNANPLSVAAALRTLGLRQAEHRRVAVHAVDGGARLEPARARGAVHPLALARPVGAGDLAEQLGADPVSEVHASRLAV